jgi:tetratricopeptide (TPR) repeat protein
MLSVHRIKWFMVLAFVAFTFTLTSCSEKSKEVVYRVTGSATQAHVTYTNGDGVTLDEVVTLPWDTQVEISKDAEFRLSASNNQPAGNIIGEVWLDGRKLGDQDSAAYVVCEGSVFLDNGNPSSFISYNGESLLGDIKKLMDEGELDKALAKAEELIGLAPNYPLAYYYNGLIYTDMGELDFAVEAYSQAVTLDSEFVDAYNKRAITYANMDELELSVADFTTTIELAPDFAAAYYGRGVVYSLMGNVEAARADLLIVSDLSDDPNLLALTEQALSLLDTAK